VTPHTAGSPVDGPHGLHVHRRRGAAPDAPMVVCVHGAADRGAAFARMGRFLPDVDLVRFDRRGYGRSAGGVPPGEGPDLLAAQITDVVEVVSWGLADGDGRAPVVVCGHSHGALLALGAALADHRIGGVVAWEPPMPWAPWWSSGQPTAGGAARDAGDPGDAMEAFLRRLLGDQRWEALPAGVRAARRSEGPALLADLAAARAAAALDIAALGVPVVAGMGGATAARHRRAVTELAAQLARVVVVDVPGADHGAHTSHPAEVADAVRQCLSMVGGDAGTLRP